MPAPSDSPLGGVSNSDMDAEVKIAGEALPVFQLLKNILSFI